MDHQKIGGKEDADKKSRSDPYEGIDRLCIQAATC